MGSYEISNRLVYVLKGQEWSMTAFNWQTGDFSNSQYLETVYNRHLIAICPAYVSFTREACQEHISILYIAP